jgi:hypothetical protein
MIGVLGLKRSGFCDVAKASQHQSLIDSATHSAYKFFVIQPIGETVFFAHSAVL